jgi:transposase
MDEVRRDEQGKKYARSKRAGRKLLMIPEKRMTEQQSAAMQALCQEYPKTGRAFQMVQQFDDLYRCQTIVEVERVLKRLTSWMMHSRLEPMKKVARSLRRNQKEILVHRS